MESLNVSWYVRVLTEILANDVQVRLVTLATVLQFIPTARSPDGYFTQYATEREDIYAIFPAMLMLFIAGVAFT